MSDIHDDYVRQLRSAGETLIKNAESLVGEEQLTSMKIEISIDYNCIPEIEVRKKFMPDMVLIERLFNGR